MFTLSTVELLLILARYATKLTRLRRTGDETFVVNQALNQHFECVPRYQLMCFLSL